MKQVLTCLQHRETKPKPSLRRKGKREFSKCLSNKNNLWQWIKTAGIKFHLLQKWLPQYFYFLFFSFLSLPLLPPFLLSFPLFFSFTKLACQMELWNEQLWSESISKREPVTRISRAFTCLLTKHKQQFQVEKQVTDVIVSISIKNYTPPMHIPCLNSAHKPLPISHSSCFPV